MQCVPSAIPSIGLTKDTSSDPQWSATVSLRILPASLQSKGQSQSAHPTLSLQRGQRQTAFLLHALLLFVQQIELSANAHDQIACDHRQRSQAQRSRLRNSEWNQRGDASFGRNSGRRTARHRFTSNRCAGRPPVHGPNRLQQQVHLWVIGE